MRLRWGRFVVLALVVGSITVCLLLPIHNPLDVPYNTVEDVDISFEYSCNNTHLDRSQKIEMSRLGRLLFENDADGLEPQKRNFTILVWKFGPMLERRHMRHFGNIMLNPFEGCSVSNCRLTYSESELNTSDAVLFHLHRMNGLRMMPNQKYRPLTQRWVFLSDESPFNTFLNNKAVNKMNMYNGLFNWSMTYRMDSDVPVPYGRTVPLTEEEIQHIHFSSLLKRKEKTKLVAVMASNCGGENGRWDYVRELQKYMQVDVYGGCGPLKCPGHFTKDCPLLANYKFYLAFENSNCRDYITEKAWWNAYHHGAVPIIMGVSKEDAARLLPPKSYIHASEFASPADLARYLMYLNRTDTEYNSYFLWKKCFKVQNEHGYFQSPVFHYCRLCEALNYNDPSPKVYSNLDEFWSTKEFCYDKYW